LNEFGNVDDDDCGSDNVGLDEVTAVFKTVFVIASSFHKAFPLNLIGYPYWLQGIW
jgi:hypothetical protein